MLVMVLIPTLSVEFDENNGSQVTQFHVRNVDDEQPHEAIQWMGVGFYHPIEIHQGTHNEETSSSQQGAPTSPHDPAPTSDAIDAPTQEQAQDPPLTKLLYKNQVLTVLILVLMLAKVKTWTKINPLLP